jgi:hypothetical protein
VLSISLPATDPASGIVEAWATAVQAQGLDVSREARRLLADALAHGERLARIEAQIAALAAGGGALATASPAPATASAEEDQALDALFDFG